MNAVTAGVWDQANRDLTEIITDLDLRLNSARRFALTKRARADIETARVSLWRLRDIMQHAFSVAERDPSEGGR